MFEHMWPRPLEHKVCGEDITRQKINTIKGPLDCILYLPLKGLFTDMPDERLRKYQNM